MDDDAETTAQAALIGMRCDNVHCTPHGWYQHQADSEKPVVHNELNSGCESRWETASEKRANLLRMRLDADVLHSERS